MKRLVIIFLVILSHKVLWGQENPKGTNFGDWENARHAWSAWWISHPLAPTHDYGVFLFRKNFEIDSQPDHFTVHVSADNHYRLFVNGIPVCDGPAKGNFEHWNYETIDIAPYLVKGNNILAAQVFNFGEYKSPAQFSRGTAFILQGDEGFSRIVNTDNSWKVFQNNAYSPLTVSSKNVRGFYVVGPCDSIDSNKYPWDWEMPGYDDSKWLNPCNSIGERGYGKGFMHGASRYLCKRELPMMEEKQQRFTVSRRTTLNGDQVNAFLKGGNPLIIESNSKVKILIDNTVMAVGYPCLSFSKGKQASIRMEYAEALYNPSGEKGNRNEIEGKELTGAYDVIVADGGINRLIQPLWLRTFRYVQLEIETSEEPLVLNDFYFNSNNYPFEEKASVRFEPALRSFDKIWETGWRTARLCANETYWDCPYYEQLQYIGDTRIQALISLYVSGDDRLMRNALLQFNNSITGEGLTLCRAPSQIEGIIPPFSLIYIGMLNDYLMHRPDVEFLKPLLPNVQVILSWFDRRMQANGLLGPVDWWPFADWADGFRYGIPAGAEEGNSTLLTLTYAKALQDAVSLYSSLNKPFEAADCMKKYQLIKKGINTLCFDMSKGLYADTPAKNIFSQHANVMALLSDVVPAKTQKQLMEKVLADTSLIQCTLYYKFYLVRALQKLKMGDYYIDQLKLWEDMLNLGLTTFPEKESKTNWEADTRSDCHGWSASVCYDFLSIICGINPSSPGFKTIEIAPSPGELKHVEGSMPHPDGMITIDLNFNDNQVKGMIKLPETVTGKFVWNGKKTTLKGGMQTIVLK